MVENTINCLPAVEEIRELKQEIPSYQEFLQGYNEAEIDELVAASYDAEYQDQVRHSSHGGPCANSLCGCSCLEKKCVCSGSTVRDDKTGNLVSATGRTWWEPNNIGASGKFGTAIFSCKDSNGEIRFLSSSVGGKISATPISINMGVELGANLYELKTRGVEGRIGINADTNMTLFDNGEIIEAKGLGFGFSLGKKIGVYTPVAGISVDTGCVIQ